MTDGAATMDNGSLTVLILEDEPMILWDLEQEFSDAGLHPITARSAEQALDLIGHTVPDVAVLDVNLGDGKTCEPVADRLSQLGVPFLIHSGDLDRAGEVVRRFDVPVMPKPTPAYLLAEAARALR